MSKLKKKKNSIEKISNIALIIIIGLFFGGLLIIMDEVPTKNEIDTILVPALGMLTIFISMYIQIIIHETGHLFFGLITNYKFVSFRIGSIILIKVKNKFKFKKLKLAGTAGQCLMAPPELKNDKIPVILYNFGGAMMNLLISIISLIIAHYTKNIILLSYSLQIFALVGLLYAAQNGIPMKTAEIDNDGLNAISLTKHPEAQKAFWLQLTINAEISNGKRLKDLPKEWFEMPNIKDLKNSIIATLGVFSCNYAMEKHNFEETNKKIEYLLNEETAIIGIHRFLLINDQIYCELIEGNNDKIKELLTQNQKNFMKTMNTYPSIIRTEYTLALLLEKNIEKANKIKKQFISRSKTYPYPSDIKSEKELIDIATNISKK